MDFGVFWDVLAMCNSSLNPQINCLLDIDEGFFLGLTIAVAARQTGHFGTPHPILILIQNYLSHHSISLLPSIMPYIT
jgi:hypothetical protein